MENLYKILNEAPQVWFARESPPSQGDFPLTQVVCPQSTGGYYIKTKSQTRLLEAKQMNVQRQSYKFLKRTAHIITR